MAFFLPTSSLKVFNSTGPLTAYFLFQNSPAIFIDDRSGLQAGQSSTLFFLSCAFVACEKCFLFADKSLESWVHTICHKRQVNLSLGIIVIYFSLLLICLFQTVPTFSDLGF